MVIRTSISTHCNFIHLPNFLFNRNHSHEMQNILLREQKKKKVTKENFTTGTRKTIIKKRRKMGI